MTVFKEGLQSTNTVNLIGGERKITVTLLEYTPKKCTLERKPLIKRRKKFLLCFMEKTKANFLFPYPAKPEN